MTDRRGLFAALAAGLLPQAAGAAPPDVPDQVFNPEQAKITQESFGELLIYFTGSTGQLGLLETGRVILNPGATPHPPHQHPEEELLLVTEGAGEISIDGKIHASGPGAMMYCAANRLHGIVNTGRTPLTFYFVKWDKQGQAGA